MILSKCYCRLKALLLIPFTLVWRQRSSSSTQWVGVKVLLTLRYVQHVLRLKFFWFNLNRSVWLYRNNDLTSDVILTLLDWTHYSLYLELAFIGIKLGKDLQYESDRFLHFIFFFSVCYFVDRNVVRVTLNSWVFFFFSPLEKKGRV